MSQATVQPVSAGDQLAHSRDLAAENRRKLAALFPGLVTETADGPAIDADALRDLVGATVDADTREKFGLSWHGKAAARRLALTPSAAALRPDRAASVDFDRTANALVAGDNLEALKLLQKSYSGRVKLVYIDPPYNTGKDFVYKDDFRDPVAHYLRLTGQNGGDGEKLTSNPESGGRFHTDWLNMIYPRLLLARELLREDGIIFVSIDDGELNNMISVLNEVFGEENRLGVIVWKSRQMVDNRTKTGISTDHEFVIAYRRTEAGVLRGSEKDMTKFKNPDSDLRGNWRSGDLTGLAGPEARPNLHYDLKNPATGDVYPCPPKGWRYDPKTMAKKIEEERILWPDSVDQRPRHKMFASELQSDFMGFSSVLEGLFTHHGTRDIRELLGEDTLAFPKPVKLLTTLIEQTTSDDDLILDFFAGSGTTGHAVMEQNAADGGNRRFVLVQLPEPTGRASYPSIADLTAERLRRAGAKVRAANPLFTGDTGFRVFKLDSANVAAWDAPTTDVLRNSGDGGRGQLDALLLNHVDAVKPGRSAEDLLWGAALNLGLPDGLAGRVETRLVGGRTVYVAGAGRLLACFDKDRIDLPGGETLAAGLAGVVAERGVAGEVTVLLLDAAFGGNDAAKVNLVENLNQRLPAGATARVRSL